MWGFRVLVRIWERPFSFFLLRPKVTKFVQSVIVLISVFVSNR
jgi:hypothetical protein